jgi:hypothetical protein
MTKKDQEIEIIQNEIDTNEQNEMVNGENTENVENEENDKELTPEQIKAQKVLRAKLPELTLTVDGKEISLNFEKRTGSFFTGSFTKMFDKDGAPIFENGVQKERLTRTVIATENGDGDTLPEFLTAKSAIEAKRAAALVLHADVKKERLLDEKAEIENRLAEINKEIENFDVNVELSKEVVMAIVLPERTEAERTTLKVKLESMSEQTLKMRNMLKAMGLSDEQIDAQLNS